MSGLTKDATMRGVEVTTVAEYLAFAPMFAPLSQADRLDLASRMRPRHFARNEIVFHQDDPAAHVYLVATGTVKISIEDEGGQEVVIALVRGGDVFGELGVLEDGPRSATVTALTETVAFA